MPRLSPTKRANRPAPCSVAVLHPQVGEYAHEEFLNIREGILEAKSTRLTISFDVNTAASDSAAGPRSTVLIYMLDES